MQWRWQAGGVCVFSYPSPEDELIWKTEDLSTNNTETQTKYSAPNKSQIWARKPSEAWKDEFLFAREQLQGTHLLKNSY